ncbi:ABC transporter ATP-binding protein [Pseudoclavibacter chungangensis]|uniref:ABC-type quaternary amine transporter n=1 Tax=Pseudoclavibacter chungangensis TaxID=587635 RepID=A0A7J5C1Q5_9MICO|nr:ABC transporter ATP-binding protein [Pseudoclavibacter chungangensis]KAB1662567.1 ABC transporter ATP-binding protein [Pseudoclavibacter chungangensis]NYJ68612.1 ABC-type Fe3+/spermidine/putrescine transport system ATPase subunit [Pseudoclavibacter chungangensis]
MTTAGLAIENIAVDYGSTRANQDITLSVPAGEVLALIGPSGCGKSTLLRAIAGLVPVATGSVTIGGRDVTRLSPAQRNIGLVPQNYAMFPHLSVNENIAYGLRARHAAKAHIAERVDEMLELTRLTEFAQRRPDALSGGQRQRVALARALAVDPDLVLMDEPLSALDPQLRGGLRRELAALIADAGYTTIIVTHDQGEALALGDRIATLERGRLVQHAVPAELWNAPENAFVADFLAGALLLDVTWDGDVPTALDGRWRFDPSARLAPQAPGRLLVRADSLTIVPGDEPGTVAATVTAAEFAGDTTRLRVAFGDGVECDVLAEGPVTVGGTVALALPPEAVHLV